MNLWIKYGPLMYTVSTRLNWPIQIKNRWVSKFSNKEKTLNIMEYIRDLIVCWIFVITYFVIRWNVNVLDACYFSLLYVYLYITFIIFYEIWYIYNDVFSVKKEKNPTNYIWDLIDSKFRKINIIYRIILWCILLWLLYFLNYSLFFPFVINLIIMWIAFAMHNLIRNYNINIFTWSILRISKIVIFLIILQNLWVDNHELVEQATEAYLLFNLFDYLIWFVIEYNRRLWWTNSKEIYSYSYIILLFLSIIIWILLNNPLFFIVSLFTCPRVIKNAIILFKKYWIKSNR